MRKFASLVSCLILSSQMLIATDISEDNRLKPGARQVSHNEWVKIQEQRSKLAQACEADPTMTDEEEEVSSTSMSSLASAATSIESLHVAAVNYTSHAGALHNAIGLSVFGDTVELEDGSIWTVSGDDSYKTLNWLNTDFIVITANHSWFSSYQYCMTNQNTGVSVKVNLYLGPVYNGVYTHWITAINYYTQEISLEDGSIWKLSGFDSSTFNKWMLNDTIIIGVNDGYFAQSKPNILINVNTLSYSKAKCVW